MCEQQKVIQDSSAGHALINSKGSPTLALWIETKNGAGSFGE